MKKQTPKQTKLPKAKPSRTAVAKKSAASPRRPEVNLNPPIIVFVGVDTQGRITYSRGNPNGPGFDGGIDAHPGDRVQFKVSGGHFLLAFKPRIVRGETISQRSGSGGSGAPVDVDVPTGAHAGDTYKYSVAIANEGAILVSDPVLRIIS